MAKSIYVGVSSVARKVKQPFIGVSNVARKVKDGYIGVSGVARQFYSSGYVWKKYNVNQKWDYKLTCQSSSHGTENSECRMTFYSDTPGTLKYTFYKGPSSITQDTTTGKFSASGQSSSSNGSHTYSYISSLGKYEAYVNTLGTSTRKNVWVLNELLNCTIPTFEMEWWDDNDTSLVYYSYRVNQYGGTYGPMFISYDAGSNNMKVYQAYSTTSKGSYIEDVTSDNSSAYPTNGIHTDGYWYVKQ